MPCSLVLLVVYQKFITMWTFLGSIQRVMCDLLCQGKRLCTNLFRRKVLT